jgi:hypothetical protein
MPEGHADYFAMDYGAYQPSGLPTAKSLISFTCGHICIAQIIPGGIFLSTGR